MAADHVDSAAEGLRTDHGVAQERIGTAQTGWIGTSGDALSKVAAKWEEDSTAHYNELIAHVEGFKAAAAQYVGTDDQESNRHRQRSIESGPHGALTRGDNTGRRSGLATRADRRSVPGGSTACPHQRSGRGNAAQPVGVRDVEGRSRRGRAAGHQPISHHAGPVAERGLPRRAGGRAKPPPMSARSRTTCRALSITPPPHRPSSSTWPPIR